MINIKITHTNYDRAVEFYSADDIESALRDAGFARLHSRGLDMLHASVGYALSLSPLDSLRSLSAGNDPTRGIVDGIHAATATGNVPVLYEWRSVDGAYKFWVSEPRGERPANWMRHRNWVVYVALSDGCWANRQIAVEELADQELLKRIAQTDDDLDVRIAAVKKIADVPLLEKIAKVDSRWAVRDAAADRLSELSDELPLPDKLIYVALPFDMLWADVSPVDYDADASEAIYVGKIVRRLHMLGYDAHIEWQHVASLRVENKDEADADNYYQVVQNIINEIDVEYVEIGTVFSKGTG